MGWNCEQKRPSVERFASVEHHRQLVTHFAQVVSLVGHAQDPCVDAVPTAAAQDVHKWPQPYPGFDFKQVTGGGDDWGRRKLVETPWKKLTPKRQIGLKEL